MFAAAVRELLGRPQDERRAEARRRAELFGWDRSVAAFLAAHGVPYLGGIAEARA
ncbi:hypothetical protein [Streptomyces sp. NPDC002540]